MDADVLSNAIAGDATGAALKGQPLPASTNPYVASLIATVFKSRRRRMLAIGASIGVVGLLQGLLFLTVIEPGRTGLAAIIAATLIYSVPSLLLWLAARTVNAGQPSELGLWAGLAIGAVSGAAFLISVQSLGEVRLVTAILAFAAAVVFGYFMLLVFATVLRAAQTVGRFSSDSIAATLACLGASSFGLIPALMDAKAAAWLYPAAALTFPVVLVGIMSLTGAGGPASGLRQPPRVLLLRTFGDATRSNRLLRHLANSWLEVGPIDMLAGPDITASVVTIEKLQAWLTGRLRSQFIGGAADFARGTAAGITRFRDGRYPVAEWSCLASSWRHTVTGLTHRANSVIMDLRSFTRQNRGCIFEIRTLIANTGPERIVFLVDASTDLAALNDVLGRHFRANVYLLDGDNAANLQRAVWAAFGTLGEESRKLT